ncbi:MEDS domain-containing protein [Saccharothrix isguenensis]
METAERQAGVLPDLVGLRPGSHVCCVVDAATPFEAWTVDCLDEGLRQGQKLFRFGPEDALRGLSADRPVVVADPRTSFLGGEALDPEVMYAMFREQSALARREGYSGLRLVADMDWLPAETRTADIASFELVLDEVVRELDATVVCAYRTGNFDAETVAEVVAVHPVAAGRVAVAPGFRMWNVAPGEWQLAGEIDIDNAGPFRRALETAARGVTELRLRTGGLDFVALAGVSALASVAAARPNLSLVVDNACDSLVRCWDVCEFGRRAPAVVVRPAGGPEPTGGGR